jgi:hypothetical protein
VSLFGPRVNADGQRHADVYVAPKWSEVPLRYPSGGPTGFVLDAGQLVYRDGRGVDGSVRLDFHERVASLVGDLVFHRGGNGFVDAQNVKYGHLAVSDLASDPGQPVPAAAAWCARCCARARSCGPATCDRSNSRPTTARAR